MIYYESVYVNIKVYFGILLILRKCKNLIFHENFSFNISFVFFIEKIHKV